MFLSLYTCLTTAEEMKTRLESLRRDAFQVDSVPVTHDYDQSTNTLSITTGEGDGDGDGDDGDGNGNGNGNGITSGSGAVSSSASAAPGALDGESVVALNGVDMAVLRSLTRRPTLKIRHLTSGVRHAVDLTSNSYFYHFELDNDDHGVIVRAFQTPAGDAYKYVVQRNVTPFRVVVIFFVFCCCRGTLLQRHLTAFYVAPKRVLKSHFILLLKLLKSHLISL
jgi:hypothetical protein